MATEAEAFGLDSLEAVPPVVLVLSLLVRVSFLL